MSWPVKIIRFSFHSLFLITPAIFLPNTSELFEFNKMIVVYLLSALIFTAWLLEIIMRRKFVFTRTMLDLPILIFLLTNLISLLLSLDPRTSLMGYYSRFNGGLLSLMCYSLLYWAFVTFMDSKAVKTCISTSLWIIFLISLYAIFQHYGIDADMWIQDVQNRVFSTLGQPNWLAAFIITLIFISFSQSLRKPGFVQLSLSVILILALLFTKSRSGLLAFGISSLVFWTPILLGKIPHLKHSLRTFTILGISGLIFTLAFSNPIRDLFVSPTATTPGKTAGPALEVGGTESGTIRNIVWTGAIRAWLSSPKTILIGTGPETFTMAYYQHRPIEHNATSEWDLLYNKAHNEFINYLTTTGLIGLLTYLFLLGSMLTLLIRSWMSEPKSDQPPKKHQPQSDFKLEKLAFMAGWLTIPVTNFLGFSVVMVQIMMFLLPAISYRVRHDEAHSDSPIQTFSPVQIILILITISLGGFLLITTTKYWLADVKYAAGQNYTKAFKATQDPVYALNAYESLGEAFELNPSDPVIAAEYSIVNAYISAMASESDPTSAAQLSDIALNLADRAVNQSPHHPNYYKFASQTAMILGTIDPDKMRLAISATQKARAISPTDPAIPYSLGLVYYYLDEPDQAAIYFRQALQLKPDHANARLRLEEVATFSAQTK